VCCSALQCVAVRCSVLQCVAVCSSFQYAISFSAALTVCCRLLQIVTGCCSVLHCVKQCVAVRFGELQYVAPKSPDIGLVCRDSGLFCGYIRLFCRYIGSFGRNIGIFCGYVRLFAGMEYLRVSTQSHLLKYVLHTNCTCQSVALWGSYGVAMISGLLKIMGLFCRTSPLFRALLQKRPVINTTDWLQQACPACLRKHMCLHKHIFRNI